MRGKVLRKTIAVLLMMGIMIGTFAGVKTQAKSDGLATPKISVKVGSDGEVSVTVKKTADADGYEIYVKGLGEEYVDMYGEYDYLKDEYSLAATIEKSGKKKRSITLRSLPSGEYTVKVRSYNKKYNKKTFSDYSGEKKIKVSVADVIGYTDKYDLSETKKGDVILFGAYEQDNDLTNGKEPIEWIVLEKNKKSMLVMSKYALDGVPYNKKYQTDINWSNCTLHSWLDEKFYAKAFNTTEQSMIKTVTVKTPDNAYDGEFGGEDTEDRIFIPSMSDMTKKEYGFSTDFAARDGKRVCVPTAYAVARGVRAWDEEGVCDWTLRTAGKNRTSESVDRSGVLVRYDIQANNGIRPMMYIMIE
ncbi:MAG: DUF6273 domain-containing protein [Lachnospiraceae bacterium]|nr:DUF6273 domain-containing protein [Lachnospiraceae bacterium]